MSRFLNREGLGGGQLPDVDGSAPAPALAGFYLNGSTNAALKAAVAGVKAGTRRGTTVVKGDSTSVPEGGGSGQLGLVNARPYRPAAVAAAALTQAGIRAIDSAMVGDGGVDQPGGLAIYSYDPRFTAHGSWTVTNDKSLAGGGFLNGGYDPIVFTSESAADRARIVFYDNTTQQVNFEVNGAAPQFGPGSVQLVNPGGYGFGFREIVVGLNSPGPFALGIAGDPSICVRSIQTFSTQQPALDFLVHACRGATTQQLAGHSTDGSLWANGESLLYDKPDLTIINSALNDMIQGRPVSEYQAAIEQMIADARVTGDVLLVFPHPAGGNFNNNVAAFHAAAKVVAASRSVALLSLYEYFGGAFTPELAARMFDGLAHPSQELYAEIGRVSAVAVRQMAAV